MVDIDGNFDLLALPQMITNNIQIKMRYHSDDHSKIIDDIMIHTDRAPVSSPNAS